MRLPYEAKDFLVMRIAHSVTKTQNSGIYIRFTFKYKLIRKALTSVRQEVVKEVWPRTVGVEGGEKVWQIFEKK